MGREMKPEEERTGDGVMDETGEEGEMRERKYEGQRINVTSYDYQFFLLKTAYIERCTIKKNSKIHYDTLQLLCMYFYAKIAP